MAAMITDIFIIALLVGGIGYGVLISRRVQRLMATLKELEPAVREFSVAVDKSEASVTEMRQNLEEGMLAAAAPEPEEPAGEAEGDPMPAFSTRRYNAQRIPGVRVVRDKQDLVRRFFETTRAEKRA
jgi:hypothetical protein